MAAKTGEGVSMDVSDPACSMNLGVISTSVTVFLTVPHAVIFWGFVLLEEQNLLENL